MENQEIHDFYIQRSYHKKLRNEPLHTVSADVDKYGEINRNALLYWKKDPNDSMVRIPRICFMGDIEDKIADFFGTKYKVLTGGHVFMEDDGQMDYLQTFLDCTGHYSVTRAKPISCVYPCYQNNKRQKTGRMLLGL